MPVREQGLGQELLQILAKILTSRAMAFAMLDCAKLSRRAFARHAGGKVEPSRRT
ncbi:MAG TPA: hypothetical protein VMK12_15820 [Anaeromyxobacteraceae bacterium]|nr:hypothetical protein [Anaeromyxobacteraceae bacterium]